MPPWQGLHPLHRQREVELLPFVQIEGRQADQAALFVEQAAAAGTWGDRRGGLNVASAVHLAQAGNDAFRQGEFQSPWRADDIHPLTDLQIAGCAQGSGHGVQPRHGQAAYIPVPVAVPDFGRVGLVAVVDRIVGGAFQNVAVGRHVATRQDDAAALALLLALGVKTIHDNHALGGLLENLAGGLGLGLQCRESQQYQPTCAD